MSKSNWLGVVFLIVANVYMRNIVNTVEAILKMLEVTSMQKPTANHVIVPVDIQQSMIERDTNVTPVVVNSKTSVNATMIVDVFTVVSVALVSHPLQESLLKMGNQ